MRTLSMAAAALLLAAAPATGAGGATATAVDDLSATAFGSLLDVRGRATFVDVPVQVGEDAQADSLVPGIGADLVTASIARPDPFGPTLVFSVGVADAPPALDGAPEIVNYDWRFDDPASDDPGTGYVLAAWRSAQWVRPGTLDPAFHLWHCTEATGCAVRAALPGSFGQGTVRWMVPMDLIGAGPGDVITPGTSGVTARVGLSALIFSSFAYDQMAVEEYVVPGPSVEIGLGPAGIPDGAVPLAPAEGIATDGSFWGYLETAGLPPGDHKVVARACLTASNCGVASLAVALPG